MIHTAQYESINRQLPSMAALLSQRSLERNARSVLTSMSGWWPFPVTLGKDFFVDNQHLLTVLASRFCRQLCRSRLWSVLVGYWTETGAEEKAE